MVYVWRTNGTVLAVSWDALFFTLAHVAGEWEVRGHVLDADKNTVLESFALSYRDVLSAHDLSPTSSQCSDQDFVRSHWEFVRRYMEEGPMAVSDQVKFCMPVSERKEKAIAGMHRVFANFSGGSWVMVGIMAPFCLAVALGRVLAMKTSKIPVWPQEVEAACAVEEGDPYAIVGDAEGHRIAVYPEAANAAGVGFKSETAHSA